MNRFKIAIILIMILSFGQQQTKNSDQISDNELKSYSFLNTDIISQLSKILQSKLIEEEKLIELENIIKSYIEIAQSIDQARKQKEQINNS